MQKENHFVHTVLVRPRATCWHGLSIDTWQQGGIGNPCGKLFSWEIPCILLETWFLFSKKKIQKTKRDFD